MSTVLVAGATGYVGSRLVPALLARGHRVRCLTRDPRRVVGGAEMCVGDALDPATLPAALAGVDTVYYLVHSMAAGETGFEERDRRAARNVATAARAAGVRHLIYLGGLAQPGADLSRHLASRQETGAVLRETGIPVTELRAAIVVGAGSISFEMIRYLTERLPVMVCPKWVSTRCQPIAVDDVIAYLLACLDEPGVRGRTLEIGGADVLTYGEMMMRYARARGLRRWMIPVPVLTPRLSSLWVDLVTPIPAAFARPLIGGLTSAAVVTDPAARALLPTIRPVGYDEAVARALADTGRDDGPGRIVFHRTRRVNAPPAAVWQVIAGLGGDVGWLHLNVLWRIRGGIDRLLGGVGLRRGRPATTDLRPGDRIDWWRVEAVEPGHSFRLAAEMKVPGRAWLELGAEPIVGDATMATLRAIYEPRGLLGIAYWYVLLPVHVPMFNGFLRAIARRAEREGGGQRADVSPRS
jgi:uncharacterized protein YbjT (DUF2867 family)